MVRLRAALEQLLKLFNAQAGIAHDAAHRQSINWIVPRDGENACAIGHDDVLALTDDAEACLLQSPDRFQMIDAGNLRHG
jgi:hypothetical protein